MPAGDLLFLTFSSTIVVTRLWLWKWPRPGPTVCGIRLHHYVFGILLMLAGVTIDSIEVLAVGLGLFVDEATYLIIGGRTHADNFSTVSLAGTALLMGAVFAARTAIAKIVLA